MSNNARLTAYQLAQIMLLRATGHTQAEIAEKVGTSQAVVSYQLRKLRKRSRETSPEAMFREHLLYVQLQDARHELYCVGCYRAHLIELERQLANTFSFGNDAQDSKIDIFGVRRVT